MLASRSQTVRTVLTRSTRAYATSVNVTDAAGVKVAGIDAGQPTTSISVVVKAGSRYETLPGVAHALKNFAFKVSLGGLMVGMRVFWAGVWFRDQARDTQGIRNRNSGCSANVDAVDVARGIAARDQHIQALVTRCIARQLYKFESRWWHYRR
jgi:predicted Zn-dependent peptidase